MAFNSILNQGEYISSHYLASLLKHDLEGLRKRWRQAERAPTATAEPASSAQGVKSLSRTFFRLRNRITEQLGEDLSTESFSDARVLERLRELNDAVLKALAFTGIDGDGQSWLRRGDLDVTHLGEHRKVPVALAVSGSGGFELVALEATWAAEVDGIVDETGGSQLLSPIKLDGSDAIEHAGRAVQFLFGCEEPPRYVLLLAGNVVLLAESTAWPNGYLAVDLGQALHAGNDKAGGELETIAALFGAESLLTCEGQTALSDFVAKGRKHAVSVSKELREALRQSVELIAQEILDRIHEHDADPADLGGDLARRLTEQSLRYLYRILFLLYAEAKPELGILPSKNEAYKDGYGIARLGDLVSYDLPEEAEQGLYFHESLALLFKLVDEGHRPSTTDEVTVDEEGNEIAVDRDGIRFEPLKSELFDPKSTSLISEAVRVGEVRVDTRLRNKCLWQVLNLLMLTPEPGRGRGRKQGRRGFISYANLGINQLGAVYEGLMSYTGFFAPAKVYEVAKTVKTTGRSADGADKEKADPTKGTWIVPAGRADEYDPKYFVTRTNPITGESERVCHEQGSFVYRLSGRERQRSASYYTPEVLTDCTVKHALAELLTDEMTSRDILDLTICEPALGSGAFLNEAINQLAAAYMERAQKEQGDQLLPDQLERETQKVKAYIALHNCYGVDLNATAVELAEVSLWLNVMHEGLQAPWFGLHLRRGNSLIGVRRAVYNVSQLKRGAWRSTPPVERPLRCDASNQIIDKLANGEIHHFLLPADGWGAVVEADEAKELVPEERTQLMEWRREIRTTPTGKTTHKRLTGLAQRVERLWELTRKRIAASETEIRRAIDVWGVAPEPPLPPPASGVVSRDDIVKALYDDVESPYNRLKTVMDAWCALWFWPVGQDLDEAPPTLDQWLDFCEAVIGVLPATSKSAGKFGNANRNDLYGLFAPDAGYQGRAGEEADDRSLARCLPMERVAIDSRFGWWSILRDIAEREGFFHWELEFAQVFGQGGFDLQIGNPPWAKLSRTDTDILMDMEPHWGLAGAPPQDWPTIRTFLKKEGKVAVREYLEETARSEANAKFLSSKVEHPILSGVMTNLYLNFMEHTWRSVANHGVAALIHEEQHLVDPRTSALRREVYSRFRRHFQFGNNLLLFEDVDNNKVFGIHVYGKPGQTSFVQMSRLVHPMTIDGSFEHDGSGEIPGIQYPWGGWDLRPHAARVLTVTEETLRDWTSFSNPNGGIPAQVSCLRPLTVNDSAAIGTLGSLGMRLGDYLYNWSPGLHEKGAQKDGTTVSWSSFPKAWSDVILQGPHFTVATPFAKEPNLNCRSNKDYTTWDLTSLTGSRIPRTNYIRSVDPERFTLKHRIWRDQPSTDYWRVMWRRRVVPGTERTLQAALLFPGPTHVHTVHTIALASNRETAIVAGLWSSIPFDFICKVSGLNDIRVHSVERFPVILNHPLVSPLLLRSLRLNCITQEYAPLWQELFLREWVRDRWTISASRQCPLGEPGEEWAISTPLRTDYDRRMALVEIDALVALMLGLSAEQLVAMYKSQFAVLGKYEWEMFFAPGGHKIGAETHNRSVLQTEEETEIVKAWKKARLTGAPEPTIPQGWVKPDREAEMTDAYNEFKRRLEVGEYPEVVEP